MNEYTRDLKTIIEIGSGLGLTKYYVNNPNLKLTDVTQYDWIDQKVDALNMPYENSSLDANVACGRPHNAASIWPVWLLSSSIACFPRITRSAPSLWIRARRVRAVVKGFEVESVSTRIARSAPMARPVRNCC